MVLFICFYKIKMNQLLLFLSIVGMVALVSFIPIFILSLLLGFIVWEYDFVLFMISVRIAILVTLFIGIPLAIYVVKNAAF